MWSPNPTAEWFIMFFYYFLLMYSFVPVSLIVSMVSVKFFSRSLIQLDLAMYDEDR
jgi:phospholipid-translocating ATPase/phospholipid-transporting ATPase